MTITGTHHEGMWMQMLMQLWRPEFELVGISSGSWYHFVCALCRAVCRSDVDRAWSGGHDQDAPLLRLRLQHSRQPGRHRSQRDRRVHLRQRFLRLLRRPTGTLLRRRHRKTPSILFCSLFPRFEGWSHHRRTFSVYLGPLLF